MIFNQKGGVGKTTTAINLGAALAKKGDRQVLLVDLDRQTHLTAALGHRAESHDWNVTDWLVGESGQTIPIAPRLSLVPGDCDPPETRQVAAAVLEALKDPDRIVIGDAPPTCDAVVASLMAAADCVLTPLEADFLGMQGISRLLQMMKRLDVPWGRLRLLLCRYDHRLIVHREVRERLDQRFRDGTLLPVMIRMSVRLAEAPGHGVSIFEYSPNSSGAKDYVELAEHLLADRFGGSRRITMTEDA